MFYKVKLANFFSEMDNQIMRKRSGISISLLSLPFLCLSLSACAAEKDDGKTYSFQVDFYNDVNEKVGYDYVAYGKASRSVRPLSEGTAYDYISRSSAPFAPGMTRKFKEWKGAYLDNDPNLPAYLYQPDSESPKRVVPTKGEEALLTNILGDCAFTATFSNAPIEFKTIFYNGHTSIKESKANLEEGESPSTPFAHNKVYRLLDLGSSISVPADVKKDVGYGYHSSFLGFGFSEGASLPFADFSNAKFLFGAGEPSSLTSYSSLTSTIVSSALASGSIYQDINAVDANGNHTTSLYGYDGEWHKFDCSSETPTLKIHSIFSDSTANEYNVALRSDKYLDSSALGISKIGHYGDEITFESSNKLIKFASKDGASSTIDVSGLITKGIRTWIAVYSSDLEKYDGVVLDQLSNKIYLSADVSLYPVFYDCKVIFGDATYWIEFGTKIKETKESDSRYVYSFLDSSGTKTELVSSTSLHASYRSDDLSLSNEKKGSSCLLTDAILGDIELH